MRRNDCPGMQRSLQKILEKSYSQPCVSCGEEIIFSYGEVKKPCPACDLTAEKSLEEQVKDFGCAGYCANAEQCLSAKRYADLITLKEKIYEIKKYHPNVSTST